MRRLFFLLLFMTGTAQAESRWYIARSTISFGSKTSDVPIPITRSEVVFPDGNHFLVRISTDAAGHAFVNAWPGVFAFPNVPLDSTFSAAQITALQTRCTQLGLDCSAADTTTPYRQILRGIAFQLRGTFNENNEGSPE